MRLFAAVCFLAGLSGGVSAVRAVPSVAVPSAITIGQDRLALALPPADPALRLAQAPIATSAEGASGSAPARRPVAAVLRSLALPGWGAWHEGHRDIGLGFVALEAAAWSVFGVSVGEGHLRRGSSEETAALYAGIDLTSHDDRFRKLVSGFRSSDEYNRLVIYRDAASLYYGDPENYNRYIEEHSLKGSDTWAWESDEQWERYRDLRRTSERAFQRARFAAAAALVNRVAAAVVASRLSRKAAPEVGAAEPPADHGHLEWSVDPLGAQGIEHRLSWVHRF